MTWYTIGGGGDLDLPGIYQWEINGRVIYVGRALNPRSRLRQYARNVARLDASAPYRRNNPDGFRQIHRRLHFAASKNAEIGFTVVENCDSARLNERERFHQRNAALFDTSPKDAAQRIATAVLSSNQPSSNDITMWLAGGAVFWQEDHDFVCWGLNLPSALDGDFVEQMGIRAAIVEADDLHRAKFGAIPVMGSLGERVLAITAWNGFFGDEIFGFYETISDFYRRAAGRGWLLGSEPNLDDALGVNADGELLARFKIPR